MEKEPPIIFKWPGLKPDTRLTVFSQEFHVHSTLLKLHSAFFRKFLDSPDKSPELGGEATSTRGTEVRKPLSAFRYDWTTMYEEPANIWDKKVLNWHLVSTQPVTQPCDISSTEWLFSGWEESIFKKLLCAIYNWPYLIEDSSEIDRLTALGNYYSTLPVISRTLDAAMIRSPGFGPRISFEYIDLYEAAFKLRNALLFRESLIYLVGKHDSNYRYEARMMDKRLMRTLRNAHERLASKIAKTQWKLLKAMQQDWGEKMGNQDQHSHVFFDLLGMFSCPEECDREWTFPQFLRWIIDKKSLPSFGDYEYLLESNLFLDKYCKAGVEDCQDYFLCAEIPDEELPWDVYEHDW